LEDIKKENKFLKNSIKLQKSVINSIPTEAKKTEEFEVKCHSLFSGMFTTTQINLILHPKKKVYKWSEEDIANAMTLRILSPKAYRYLRGEKKYPLPGWCNN